MTRENRERIQLLLIRYLDSTASPAELDQLSQYLEEEQNDKAWTEMMEELMISEPALANYDAVAWQPFIDQLRAQNAVADTVPVIPLRSKSFQFYLRRWAVAAILLIIAGGVYWYVEPRRPAPIAISQPGSKQKDFLPGGNRAVLTLAGGRTIVLDSAADGLLTQQGNSQVRKIENGHLTYQNTAEEDLAVVYNTLSTPRGGQYQLTLPDGTRVWLNAASSITYPTAFTGGRREVKITGEAYFEVKHMEAQPFFVRAGDQLIEDIGTSFNVNAYKDEPGVRTTLVTGRIKVDRGKATEGLSPGQQVSSYEGGLQLTKHADVAQALAWKNGAFSFRDADLPTVMRQLARWYDIDVEYAGAVPKGHFDGEIGRSLTLKQVFQGLSLTRINYTIINDHKILIQ